jgi:hypothetical protein
VGVDLTQVIELAGFAAAIIIALLVTGVTYFEDRIPLCIEKVDAWLVEIQADLGKEIKAWSKNKKEEKGYEQILSVASKFSAVKGMNEELDQMELRNSRQVKLNIVALIAIAGAVITFYYADAQSPLTIVYDDLVALATLVTFLAAVFWLVSVFSFYGLYSDYSRLKRLVRQKVLEPVETI